MPIFGTVSTCGTGSAPSPPSAAIDPPASLPAPHLQGPVFGCQTFVDMDGLTQGATVEVFASGVSLGTFCSCWGAVHCNLPRALTTSDALTAKQTMIRGQTCNTDGALSAPPLQVVPPDARIKPILQPVLYDGDRLVRVDNQIGGGTITLLARANAGAPENELGRIGASQFDTVALNTQLVAGQVLRAKQSLCGRDEFSDPQTVQPRPGVIPPPSVRAPLYDCATLVPIDGLLVGAQVRVFESGFPIGYAIAGASSITVHVGPSLVAGRAITAMQRVGGVDSASSAAVTVGTLAALPAPSILPPLRVGDQSVRVAGAVPGAYVEVFDGPQLRGTGASAGGIVSVALGQAVSSNSQLHARQSLCGQASPLSTNDPTPIADPSQPGGFTPSTPTDQPPFSFTVPPSPDGDGATVNIGGELTFPADPNHPNAVDPNGGPYPLVVIAHGMHGSVAPSYQGYRYLVSHLVSFGMICFSIDLNPVNGLPTGTNIDHRGDVILEVVRRLLLRNSTGGDVLQNKIDTNRIALIGHSRGAEGVVDAQVKNLARATPFAILGVVPIAPTNFLSLRFSGTSQFLIYGSFDADVSGSRADINPFFIYDHSQCPKAMIFIHHARHNGFNTVWVATDNEAVLTGALSPELHQAIAKAYIGAYFQNVLLGRTAYDAFVQGPVRPLGLEGLSIHHQYQLPGRLVVDNFGDADAQLGLGAESPLRRDRNTLADGVSYSDTSTTAWFDQSSPLVSQSPHDSDMTQLIWTALQTYLSNVNARDVRPFAFLALRLGQQYNTTAMLNPVGASQDLAVTLVTAGGEATVRVSSITDLPYPDERPGQLSVTKAALKTVRLPLTAFVGINPSLRLDAVAGVRLTLDTQPLGAISADDLEFTP